MPHELPQDHPPPIGIGAPNPKAPPPPTPAIEHASEDEAKEDSEKC